MRMARAVIRKHARCMHAPAEFIELCLDAGVLRFGEFTLKSGRVEPVLLQRRPVQHGGCARARSAAATRAPSALSGIDFDMLFGPAYKGIPLVTATAVALAEHHGRNVPFAFNRKEAKDHGEGGTIVGAPLDGPRADRRRRDHRRHRDPRVGGHHPRRGRHARRACVIALDRQERGQGERIGGAGGPGDLRHPGDPSIITLDDLIESPRGRRGDGDELASLREPTAGPLRCRCRRSVTSYVLDRGLRESRMSGAH